MSPRFRLNPQVRDDLRAIYEEIMWLARRPNVRPSAARAWYTHVMSGSVRRRVRKFSGKVSQRAVRSKDGPLRLEHYKRMQTTLTKLVERHLVRKKGSPSEFIRVVMDCERVHIVTFAENYLAMRAKGNYRKAGIKLRTWQSIPKKRQIALWRSLLRGKVANAESFAPRAADAAQRRARRTL